MELGSHDPNIRSRASSSRFTFNSSAGCSSTPTRLSSFAERNKLVFMHRRLAFMLVILIWPIFFVLRSNALAVAHQGSIVAAKNQTEASITLNPTLSEHPLNETLTPAPNFISYRVPNSPVTLLFHDFGPAIPGNELLRTIALAVGIAYEFIDEAKGKELITHGYFEYKHEFLKNDQVVVIIADFRESGRPMDYYILCQVLRGIGEFVLLREQKLQELSFEVEVEKLGYLATGHVEYKPAASPTPSVA